jgi:F420-dependent oxidoreductase-like protein
MRFSFWPSTGRPWSEILRIARHCEATGWDGLYLSDHFMPHGDFTPDIDQTRPLDGDKFECWSVLAGLAATVPRLRLGTLVSSVTYRHPAVLANVAAAVDIISGGRLVLGVGAGWQLNEHASYGLALGTLSERFDRLEEACAVLAGLLREKRTTFGGRYFQLDDAPNQPAPAQPRLPLLIGGGGEKRTLPIAARWADEWNYWSVPAVLEDKVRRLRRCCEAIGRDPAEIAVSTQALLFLSHDEQWLAARRGVAPGRSVVGTPAEVTDTMAAYARAGAGEFIVPDMNAPLADCLEACDLFLEEVAAHVR